MQSHLFDIIVTRHRRGEVYIELILVFFKVTDHQTVAEINPGLRIFSAKYIDGSKHSNSSKPVHNGFHSRPKIIVRSFSSSIVFIEHPDQRKMLGNITSYPLV